MVGRIRSWKYGKNIPVLRHTADALVKLEVGGDESPILLTGETLKRIVHPAPRRANSPCRRQGVASRVAVFKARQMHDVRFEAVCIQVLVDGSTNGSRRSAAPKCIVGGIKVPG